VDANFVRDSATAAYENEFHDRFVREHLVRFRYKDVEDFRRNGFQELGSDLYGQYAHELARFDLGLELLIYGFDSGGGEHLYEIVNPGKAISHYLRGYAAIGSGSLMALAALNRKPLVPKLPETLYRLLDAKFSAETARDVGKKTHVITLASSGKYSAMSEKEIQAVRAIWERTVNQPEPSDAIELISKSRAVSGISDDSDE
jgi:20S proteasome alpha/beta subunit